SVVVACNSTSAFTSTSLRCQPSIVIEPNGAPTTVTVPPKPKRKVSWCGIVRVNIGVGVNAVAFSFCAMLGNALIATNDTATMQMRNALLTENDFAGE